VRPNESTDLRTELKCLKVYGDVILFGGTNGFLGVGAMGFTSSVDDSGMPQQVMFCVPCGSDVDPAAFTPGYSPMRTSGGGSGGGATAASAGASALSSHFEGEVGEEGEGGAEEGNSGGSGGTLSSTQQQQVSVSASSPPQTRGARSNTAGSSGSAKPGYPHRKTATVISIVAAQHAQRFIAADDEGTLSIWYFYKHNAISDNVEGLKSPKKNARQGMGGSFSASGKMQGGGGSASQRRGSDKLIARKPILRHVFQLSSIDPTNNYSDERVVKLTFLLDETQLIVSTNKRLILLILGKRGATSIGPSSSSSSSSSSTGATADTAAPALPVPDKYTSFAAGSIDDDADLAVIGWVELDRAIPGKVGLFAMHMAQSYVAPYPGAATAELRRSITQWRITEEDGAVSTRFQLDSRKKGTNGTDGKKKCTIYRFEWSDSMFSAVLDKIKLLT
jgi:hypothetical protein